MRLNILTEGFVSPNGRAFLFPFIVHRKALKEAGIEAHLFNDDTDEKLFECDVLAVEGKFYSPYWQKNSDEILEKFEAFSNRVSKLVYFDISDSSCWDHARVLPFVDVYAKSQLLKDRKRYLKPIYGNRIFADYFHEKYGVEDKNEELSEPVKDEKLLDKLAVGWHSGLADYSLYGPTRMAAFYRIPFKPLLQFPDVICSASSERQKDISCRMGITYARDSVAWQRRKLKEVMKEHLPTDKLSRKEYFAELSGSKMILSPFGFGEITLKDFEVFLTGGLLVKPDMSHMETWPDIYIGGETIACHDWDLESLKETIEEMLANDEKRLEISMNGQKNYMKYLRGEKAASLFIEHLKTLIY